jgi:hypothetical protein
VKGKPAFKQEEKDEIEKILEDIKDSNNQNKRKDALQY